VSASAPGDNLANPVERHDGGNDGPTWLSPLCDTLARHRAEPNRA